MKKIALSLAISSVLGLTACDDTTLEDIRQDSAAQEEQLKAAVTQLSVSFDPGAGVVNLPDNILFAGTSDFTLETPAETDAKAAGETPDWGNPEAAIGATDGWGTQNAFSIALDADAGIALDPTSFVNDVNGDAVAIYEVKVFPDLGDADCADTSKALHMCKGVAKLTFGVDYVLNYSGNNILVVPLKPFSAGKTYAVTLTTDIKDTAGNSLQPSSTYSSVTLDINTLPIVDPSIPNDELNATQASTRSLQSIYNSYENVISGDFDVSADKIIHTQVFTAQSAGVPGTDPLQVTKLLNASAFAAMAAADPASVAVPMVSQGFTVAQALASQGLIPADPTNSNFILYNAANVYGAQIQVPYYLENAEGNPLTGRWEAACDNGVALASLSQEQLAALAANAGENHATCASLGLADFGIDTDRHITKYNPLPKTKSIETLDVQITLPNIDNANLVRASFGLEAITEKPAAGWPVVMMQHGITSKKEDMLAVTGILSAMGFATVAIDHPMHGSRGFTLEDGTVVNASTVDPTHYLNLASLLTARDNLRQSVADGLKLRLSLNAMVDATQTLVDGSAPVQYVVDPTNVYYLGHSLGAITGTSLTAVANTPVSEALVPDATQRALIEGSYRIKAAMLANPGGSIANFLVESPSFGPLVKATVIAGLGNQATEELTSFIDPTLFAGNETCLAAFGDTGVVDQNTALVCAYGVFEAQASAEAQAAAASGISSFAFAAQQVIEAGDPTNYAGLLSALQTPVLMIEMVGDTESGGMNPSDLVIPNSVATNPIAGTEGLANLLGLPAITASTPSATPQSGLIRYTKGAHSTLLTPSTTLPEPYPTLYSNLYLDMQLTMSTFFATNGAVIQINQDLVDACVVAGGGGDTCNPSE